MGIFRIAKAEFIKIFKKPSVYIMASILAFAIVLGLVFFSPDKRSQYSINISGDTVNEMYENFVNNTDIKTDNITKYKSEIDNNKSTINFYKEINTISNVLSTNLNDILKNYNNYVKYYEQNVINSTNENKDLAIKYGNETIAQINNLKLNYDLLKPNSTPATTSTKENEESLVITTECLKNYEIYTNYFLNSNFYKENLSLIDNMSSKISSSVNLTTNLKSLLNAFESENFINDVLTPLTNSVDNLFKASLNSEIKTIEDNTKNFISKIGGLNNYDNILMELLNKLRTSITNFTDYINNIINSSNYIAFINNEDYKKIIENVENINNKIDEIYKAETNSKFEKCSQVAQLLQKDNYGFISMLKNAVEKMQFVALTSDEISDIETTYYNYAIQNIESIKTELENYNKTNGSKNLDKYKNEFKDIAIKALFTSNYYSSYINNKILYSVTKNLSATEVQAFKDESASSVLKTYNEYKTKESITKLSYYLENNVYDKDFLNPFAFNAQSGFETNAYDFIYFSLRIATVLLIIFGITMSANLISMEYENGTIKLLAIRPYKRYKLITGKIFATMFFVSIFTLFAFIIAFIAGICVFPGTLTSTTVLAVFNANSVVLMHPLVLMLLNVLSILLEVLFYVIISIAISTIFKSFASAISFSMILYIISFALNILLGNALWYAYLPFVNIDLYKYFGGTFLANTTHPLSQMLTSPLLSNMTFFLSLGIYLAFVVISLVVTYVSFNRKEF